MTTSTHRRIHGTPEQERERGIRNTRMQQVLANAKAKAKQEEAAREYGRLAQRS